MGRNIKTLADLRDLSNPLFAQTAMKLSASVHGVAWAKEVFAMAGFRDTFFYKAIEREDIVLKKVLTFGEKTSIIDLVIKLASSSSVDSGGYKWVHPVYGEGAARNSGKVVGKCFAMYLKDGKALIMDGEADIIVDPMDIRLLIVRKGVESGYIKRTDIKGFWSNWLRSPITPSTDAKDIFKTC